MQSPCLCKFSIHYMCTGLSFSVRFKHFSKYTEQTFSSSRVKPLPALSFVLYLKVGHLTTGRRGPATGLGATVLAFFTRFFLRLALRIGWLNHVFTLFCQSLWKCPLGIILFRLGAMVAVIKKEEKNLSTVMILSFRTDSLGKQCRPRSDCS